MKSVYYVSGLLLLLVSCSVAPTERTTSTQLLAAPPMPPDLPRPLRSVEPTRREPIIMAASFAPPAPSTPPFTTLRSITFTNNSVVLKMDMRVMGFGLAYSEDLNRWTYVGEARWTNSTPSNPFTEEPGVTEHRIWIGEKQWSAVHTPGESSEWRITIVDRPNTQRFYRVYPLETVTGLP